MSKELDELFGDGGAKARPRTMRVIVVLATGLVLTVLGMACTAVPGGLVTLVAWHLAERELDRVDSGYLAVEYRQALVRLRAVVWAALIVVLILFALQFTLLCNGVYFTLWSEVIESLRPLALQPPAI